jgi:hypothetical protein
MIANSSKAKKNRQQQCLHVYFIDHSKPCRTLLQTTAYTLCTNRIHMLLPTESTSISLHHHSQYLLHKEEIQLCCVCIALYTAVYPAAAAVTAAQFTKSCCCDCYCYCCYCYAASVTARYYLLPPRLASFQLALSENSGTNLVISSLCLCTMHSLIHTRFLISCSLSLTKA